ncbi:SusC/RagA family TonB-linked outer membrane protein [Mucilaginibacter sp. SP1R1]|uniref:SusC/RagA family TonB-linked outer membrane protein n=1 Tax=Mucilaginibacter sp. SP1R1 TaxID=2723091 RepID=UPI00161952A2|nr:TonB-dependent receptor [Mucilaginibacter sp. SP1R1]MBB6149337.1 TonB-linked SusC/RagA family outer membrane protein [Mucilaginibacter sp. SP1R1]
MEKPLTPISRKLMTAILLLLTILTTFLPGTSMAERVTSLIDQPVTVRFGNETMAASLEKLKKAANDIAFNYKLNDVELVKVKAESFVNKPLKDVLNALMNNTQLEYKEKYNTIIISRKKVVVAAKVDKIAVTGTVSDADGSLAGVAIRSKNSSESTSTDINGNYKLTVERGEVLVFTFIGYKAQEVVADHSPLNVTLSTDVTGLSAVVVVGYGTQKKSDVTGAVGSLKVTNVKDRSVGSVTEMLQGQIPGVTVLNEGGDPTALPSIRLRGQSSFNNEGPLTVVDGTIYNGGPIDPADIESIDVLKDSYAAIYGAKAAGGVILITTKRGKQGKTNLDISVKGGTQNAIKILQALNAADYADAINQAYDNAGIPRLEAFDAVKNPDSRITRTNWPNALFRTGYIQDYNLNISGGNEKSTFYVSGGYRKNDAILLNTNSVRYNFRVNSDHQIKDWLKMGESMSYSYNNGQGANTTSAYTGALLTAIFYPPNASIYNADGSFGGVPAQYAGSYGDVINPVAYLKRLNNNDGVTSFTINPYVEVNLLKGLKFRSNLGITKNLETIKNFSPRILEPGKKFFDNSLFQEQNNSSTLLTEQTLNYDRVFGTDHHITALIGYTYQDDKQEYFSVNTDNYVSEDPASQYIINGTLYPSGTPLQGQKIESAVISYLSRVGYDYKGKYLINAILRRDQTSQLNAKHRTENYPGVSAGWILSKESFFPVDGLVSFAKLRASYGQSGNLAGLTGAANFPTYVSLTKTSGYLGSPATVVTGAAVDGIANENLSWERATQTDIGADVEFFNGKLSVNADAFVKTNTHFIFQPPVAAVFGVSNPPFVNGGKIQNKGIELAVKYQNSVGQLHYNFAVNGSYIKNKIIDILPGEETILSNPTVRGSLVPVELVQGNPLYSFYGYRTAGLFQSQDQINNYKGPDGTLIQPNAKPGDIKFVDINKDGKLTDADKTYLGTPFPKFNYGFTANFNYASFDLSIFLQGIAGNKIFNAVKYTGLNASIQNYNLLEDAKNAWTPTHTNTNIPRLSASDANGNFGNVSDFYVENGSYMRIKNVTLGYTLPKSIVDKIGVRNVRIYANAQNLVTFTKYTGLDPEVGINQNGVDLGLYPQSRIILVGVNVGL